LYSSKLSLTPEKGKSMKLETQAKLYVVKLAGSAILGSAVMMLALTYIPLNYIAMGLLVTGLVLIGKTLYEMELSRITALEKLNKITKK
jgi:hypothetical protein